MFNLKHPMSIRLQRWMTIVLALGVLTIAPISSEKLLPSASAGTFSNSWSVAANTLTTSSPKNGARGSSCYVERHTLTGVADGTNIQLYMRARSGTVNGITMGNYDAYLYVVNKTTGVAVAQDDDNGTGDGSGTGSWGNDSYLTVTWYSNYEIQATTFSCGVVGGYAIYSSAGTVSGGISANYTVTFNANNGTGSSSVSSITQASSGAAVTLATAGTLNRTGFTFTGWNTAADGSGTNYAAGSTYTPTSAITLYAQWNSTITYNANGATSGSIPTATTAKSSAGVTTLATNTGTLARTNYVFGGWNTNETGTGTSYAAGVTTYASSGNTTLYARWNSVISYDSNTATSGTVPANSTLFGSAGTLATNSGNLAKTNYTFAGWNTNRQGTGTNYAAGATTYPPAGAATLYAQWNSLVTYNANSSTSGSVPAATSIPPAGGTLALNTGNLAKTGATFVGWSTTSDGTGTFYAPGANYSNTGNVTLYAQYSVALSLSGSSTLGTNLGSSASSQAYVATNGIGRKTFTHVVSPTTPGITLDTSTANSAIIRVAATVLAGTYIDTITATDLTGATVTKVVTITVAAPIRFSSSNATSVTTSAGRSATLSIATTGGNTGKTFTLTHMSTPSSAGITLDTSTASTGTVILNISSAVAAGSYIESITATDSSGVAISTAITVNVNAPPVLTYESATAGSNFTSLAFNGTNQYVTVPSNSNLVMGTDYTIEWWQYQTDTNSYPRIFSFGGNGLEVSIEGGTFYYWVAGSPKILATGISVKNQWTHFAIVSRNNSVTLYQNGIAKRAAQTLSAITASNMPSTGVLCIASECNTTYYSMFGGRIANFTISKTARYSGTSTTIASFTPGFFSTVDANTLLALGAVNSEAKFTDSSSFSRTVTNINSPTGNSSHPSGASSTVSITTTQGITKRSSAFTASAGTGSKTFSISPTVDGITLDTSLTNTAYIVIADTVTATNSTTARVINETVTVTDSLGSATSFNVSITVNPPIALTATTTSFATTAGMMGYDTITATSGTGTGAITFSLVSNPVSSGITLVPGTSRNTVLTVARTVTAGTYYETVTATDSLGATTSIPITLTVNPGITLAGENGISTIRTSFGGTAQLKVIATNGASGRTFTMQAASVAQNAGITLDTTNASSGYALVKVAATVPANTYLETITVTDSQGGTARLLVTVIVNAAPTLIGPTTISMTAGKSASTTAYTAASGTGAKTLTLTGLNTGVTIDTSTANSGIVNLSSSLTSTSSTVARVINETITATDESGAIVRVALRITVNPTVVETATSMNLITTTGVAITDTVTAYYGTGNKTFSMSTSPATSGITFRNSATDQAVITVANTVGQGTYTITMTATDSVSATATLNISLTVNPRIGVEGFIALTSTAGYGYTSPIYNAVGGTGTPRFSLTSSPTNSGITLSSTTGSPSIVVSSAVTSGIYNLTLQATDSLSASSNLAVTLNVAAPVSLNGDKSVSKYYGEASTYVFTTDASITRYNSVNICNSFKYTVGSYTYESFTATTTCTWTAPSGVTAVDSLLVGGGGGGGTDGGGGGGGGSINVLSGMNVFPANRTLTFTVGAGGAMGYHGGTAAQAGGTTSFNNGTTTFTAPGGSGGGGWCSLGGAGGTAGTIGSFGSATAGANGGTGAPNCATVVGNPGSNGPTSSFIGSSTNYGGGGGGGAYPSGNDLPVSSGGLGGGGRGAGGTNTQTWPAYPGTDGLGGGGGGGRAGVIKGSGTRGGSGLLVLKYLTPSDSASSTFISVNTLQTSPTGAIRVNVPERVNAGTYYETITVVDSNGTTLTGNLITISVLKANPLVNVTIPGGGSTVVYGSPVSLTATSTAPGRFNFRKGAASISGCDSVATSSGTALCNWTPTDLSTTTISAVFSPTDSSNYNSVTTSNLVLTVSQAETLTVTHSSQDFIYTGSSIAIANSYSISGLAPIDSITAVVSSVTGNANDGTSYLSSASKAGIYSLSGNAVTFSGGDKSAFYKAISFVPGVITIARAVNNGNFNYSSSNQLTYALRGIDTPTVTAFGEATPVYSGANPEKCSINSSTGTLSILQAGTCTVTMDVPEGYNYLSTSVTKNVVINKAARSITLTTVGTSLKYGDTATVTTTFSAGSDDGTLTYTSGFPTVCQYDDAGGEVLGIRGSGNCAIVAEITEGVNYLSATSNTLNFLAEKADAPVVTTDTLNPVSYNNGTAISVSPSVTITGLKRNDAAGGVTYTYTFASSPAGSFSYSSTTPPTEGGTYSVAPSSLTLSTGSLDNYWTPTYVSSYLEVEQIDQPELVIQNLTGEVTFPIKLITSGGAPSTPAVSYYVTAATAENCRAVYGPLVAGGESIWTLQADSAGSCSVRAAKLQNRNFRLVISETATVSVLQFVKVVQPTVSNFTTGVTISSSVPLTVGQSACTSGCTPRIDSISTYTGYVGDMLVLTGINFTGATRVIFNVFTNATNFSNDPSSPDTQITVQVPTGLTAGEVGIEVVTPGGTSPRNFDFELLP